MPMQDETEFVSMNERSQRSMRVNVPRHVAAASPVSGSILGPHDPGRPATSVEGEDGQALGGGREKKNGAPQPRGVSSTGRVM